MFDAVIGDSLSVPGEGSARRRAGGEWQDCGSEGFAVQALLEDELRGLKTWLMRVEPGASAALHGHEEIEQVYCLEGSFTDGEANYAPGDFVVRAPGAPHLTASEDGATMLVVYVAERGTS